MKSLILLAVLLATPVYAQTPDLVAACQALSGPTASTQVKRTKIQQLSYDLTTATRCIHDSTHGMFVPPAPGEELNRAVVDLASITSNVESDGAQLSICLRNYEAPSRIEKRSEIAASCHAYVGKLRSSLNRLDNSPPIVITVRAWIRDLVERAEFAIP